MYGRFQSTGVSLATPTAIFSLSFFFLENHKPRPPRGALEVALLAAILENKK